MKSTLLFILSCLIFSPAFSQGYQPFKPSSNYYYQRTQPYQTGFRPFYQPSVFDLVVSIDTTLPMAQGTLLKNYSPTVICNEGTYGLEGLGAGIYFDSLANHWTILRHDGDSLFLKTQSRPGDTWVFYQNDSLQVQARHIKSESRNLWGEIDSVKLYQLEFFDGNGLARPAVNVDSFSVSKSFGMLSYFTPDSFPNTASWELQGVATPEREWGDQWLDEWQVYQYEVGDVFHLRTINWLFSQPTSTFEGSFSYKDEWVKQKVLSKSISANGLEITYQIEETSLLERRAGNTWVMNDTSYSSTTDTVLKQISYQKPSNRPYETVGGLYACYNTNSANYGEALVSNALSVGSYDPVNECYSQLVGFSEGTTAIEGVGEGFFRDPWLCNNHFNCHEYLPSYINNRFGEFGDSTLFNAQRSIVLSNEKVPEPKQVNVHLYPNPVKESLWLEINESTNSTIELSLLDVSGKELFHLSERHEGGKAYSKRLDLSTLNSGMYVYKLELGEKFNIGKLIKQ